MKRYLILILIASLLFSCTPEKKDKTITTPKYVFYFIGDGYGPAQAHLAEAYLANKKGRIKPDTLLMNTFPVHGTYTTYANNRFITGSAAAGTALASGYKTSINTICMNDDHARQFKSIAEMLRDKGMKIGIVTSVSIDHATPAVFYAHQPHRNNYYDIAVDLSKSNFNYFAGGGFLDADGTKKDKMSATANMGMSVKEKDNNKTQQKRLQNAIEIGEKAGYRFVNTKDEFKNLKNGDDKIVVFDPKPAAGMSLSYVIDQTKENFTLVDFTQKGIELLDNDKGFFMMIEGGKIDWACHANDAATTVHEVIQFDNAVEVAYKFYQQHPDETLIVICSDHETGGLTLGHTIAHYDVDYQYLSQQKVSVEVFTELMEDMKATYGNKLSYKEIYPLIKEYYGLDTSEKLKLDQYDIEDLKESIHDFIYMKKDDLKENSRKECAYGPYNPIATVASRILAHKAGIGWTTYSHTALPCPARAIGVGDTAFYGYYDNTELPQKIMNLFDLTPSDK